jgi:serine O-acetyltransferase
MQIIRSKEDYKKFVASDLLSLGVSSRRNWLWLNEIAVFQVRLRRLEFAMNCSKSPIQVLFRRFLYRRIAIKLGISISPNTIGPGLSIAHRGTIVVNGGARIGANCRLHVDVNIGTESGKSNAAPTIGDNCYIAPGAKIYGAIEIGPNTVIGANAVVNKSFVEGSQTIAGVPATVISSKSSKGYLIEGYQDS